MKYRWLIFGFAGLYILAAAFGIFMKENYTNVTEQENWQQNFNVAQLPEELAASEAETLPEILAGQPFILRVSPLEEREYIFNGSRQKVEIRQVYSGEGVDAGDEIFLISQGWSLTFSQPQSIECNFVHPMVPGKEYLVFLSGKAKNLDGADNIYRVYDESFISPVFSYDTYENVGAPVKGESTYVPYESVKNNEFFGCTEKTLESMEALKKMVLGMYS